MKVAMWIEETVVNQYTIKVNGNKLRDRGFGSFEEYMKKYGNDVWEASEEDDVIEKIIFNETIDYINSCNEDVEFEIL